MDDPKNNTSAEAVHAVLTITYFFTAPRERVWQAWSVPDHFKRWWGPRQFTCPSCTIDFRTGGKYLASMRSPDGEEFWSTGTYREIVPMETIVCTDSFADEHGNIVPASYYGMPGNDWPEELHVTLKFEDADGGTRMTLRHAGIPDDAMKEMTERGWKESFDKLEESLK